MRVALIDTDILLYIAAFSAEDAIDWRDNTESIDSDIEKAKTRFNGLLKNILVETKADRYVLALSSPENWRKKLLPSYKGNRQKVKKPELIQPMKAWIFETYRKDVQMIEGLEGDDVIGIRATCGKPHEYIMVSIDKDLKTVPGKHYDFKKKKFFIVTPEEAELFHLTQTLTGDIIDGYKGLPGCGEKRAKKILEEDNDLTLWEKVVTAYEKKGLTEEDALIQARMAFILQHDFFNLETEQLSLWTRST